MFGKCKQFCSVFNLPENMLAIAAIIKLMTTPGPAAFFATIPATTYIPVPTQLPTPSDVKSRVVRHFWNKKLRERLKGWDLWYLVFGESFSEMRERYKLGQLYRNGTKDTKEKRY